MDVVNIYFALMLLVIFETACECLTFVDTPMTWEAANNHCINELHGNLACLSPENKENILNNLTNNMSVWIGAYTTFSSLFKEKEVSNLTSNDIYNVKRGDLATCQLLCGTYFTLDNKNCECFQKGEVHTVTRNVYKVRYFRGIRGKIKSHCSYQFCHPDYKYNVRDMVNSDKCKNGYHDPDFIAVCGLKSLDAETCVDFNHLIYRDIVPTHQKITCEIFKLKKAACQGQICKIAPSKVDDYITGIGMRFVTIADTLPRIKCLKGRFTQTGYRMEFNETVYCNEKHPFFCDNNSIIRSPTVCNLDSFTFADDIKHARLLEGSTIGIAVGVSLASVAVIVILLILLKRRKHTKVEKPSTDQRFSDIQATKNPSYESHTHTKQGSENEVITELGIYQTIEPNDYTYNDSDYNRNAVEKANAYVEPNMIPNKKVKRGAGKIVEKNTPKGISNAVYAESQNRPHTYLDLKPDGNFPVTDLPENYFVLMPEGPNSSAKNESSLPDNYFILEHSADDSVKQRNKNVQKSKGTNARVDPGYELQTVSTNESKVNGPVTNADMCAYSLAVNVDCETEKMIGRENKEPPNRYGDYFVLEAENGNVQNKKDTESEYVDSEEGAYDHLHGTFVRKLDRNQDHLYSHTNTPGNRDSTYDTTNAEHPYKRDSTYDTTKDVIGDDSVYDTTRNDR